MATRREQILAAAATALNGASKPSGFTCGRSRTRPLAQGATRVKRGDVYAEAEEVDYESVNPQVMRRLRWRVALRTQAKEADAEVPDTILDELHLWTTEAVFADRYFGDLAVGTVEVGSEWVMEEAGEGVFVGCDVVFETQYVTEQGDQESVG